MASADEVLAPLRGALVPVPAVQDGVCRLCRTAVAGGWSVCFPCKLAEDTFGHVDPVLPLTMSIDHEQVHYALRSYKDGQTVAQRLEMSLRLSALLAVFLGRHVTRGCVEPWDLVVCVPSDRRIAMKEIVTRIPALQDRYAQVLTARPDGWVKGTLDVGKFAVSPEARGQRVLLLDDTFTRGTTLYSAAAALRSAGATICGPVVLGRHVNPSWAPNAELLPWLRTRQWKPDRCGICDGERRVEAGSLF